MSVVRSRLSPRLFFRNRRAAVVSYSSKGMENNSMDGIEQIYKKVADNTDRLKKRQLDKELERARQLFDVRPQSKADRMFEIWERTSFPIFIPTIVGDPSKSVDSPEHAFNAFRDDTLRQMIV